jgi:hypothetical protein
MLRLLIVNFNYKANESEQKIRLKILICKSIWLLCLKLKKRLTSCVLRRFMDTFSESENRLSLVSTRKIRKPAPFTEIYIKCWFSQIDIDTSSSLFMDVSSLSYICTAFLLLVAEPRRVTHTWLTSIGVLHPKMHDTLFCIKERGYISLYVKIRFRSIGIFLFRWNRSAPQSYITFRNHEATPSAAYTRADRR